MRLSGLLSGRPLAARSRHEAAWRESRRRNVAVGRKMKSSAVKTAIVRMRSYWKYAAVTGAVTHPGASSETNAYADV
jgi:hypothetical protein